MDTLNRLIKQYGGPSALARALGVKPQAVTNWRSRGVPAEQAVKIETLTAGKTKMRDLRPDLYPKEGRAA